MTHRRKAFTLVELLVVISIIGVLLGMLLPALGQAKRKANQIKDVANLQEHGKGTASYASANEGRMPTAPPGNGATGGRGFYTGQRNLPALRFAAAVDGDGQGFDQNASHAWNGWAFSQGGLTYDDIWRAYHFAFGDWIVDAEGANLLHEVFASPGSFVEENFASIRTLDIGEISWPEDFPGTSNRQETPGQAAFIQPCGVQVDGGATCFLQPSYRYTLAGLYGKSLQTGEDFFGLTRRAGGGSQRAWDDGATAGNTWSDFRSYVQQSAFQFPSQKVTFWEFWAEQSPRAAIYFMPNAKVSVATLDGSAKIVEPFVEMPDLDETREAIEAGVGWGTNAEYGVGGVQNTDQRSVGGLGATDKPYAWFAMTDFGTGGRDLSGRGR